MLAFQVAVAAVLLLAAVCPIQTRLILIPTNKMRRPILISVLILLLAFGICFWWLKPLKGSVAQTATSPMTERTPEVIVPSSASALPPKTSAVPDSKPLLTEVRRRIMDAPDLMKAISEIRLHGTQDEKDWALFIMMACDHVHLNGSTLDDPEMAANPSASGMPATNRELAKERRIAFESISQRCKGFSALDAEDKKSLRSELITSSGTNSSVLARLHTLATTDENRWSDEQATLISNSLYSGDPILQREAFFAAQRSIDLDAPGGAEPAP